MKHHKQFVNKSTIWQIQRDVTQIKDSKIKIFQFKILDKKDRAKLA